MNKNMNKKKTISISNNHNRTFSPFTPFTKDSQRCAQLGRRQLQGQLHVQNQQQQLQQQRFMGGGGGDSMSLHVSEFHLTSAKVMTTVCWAWMIWRTYQDGAFVFLGIHPFPHDDHGDEHGHKSYKGDGEYKDTGFDSPPEYVEEEE